MENDVFIAVLAGLFSIVTASIAGVMSYKSALRTMRTEQNGVFLEVLLQHRLKTYPALLDITYDVGKKYEYINGEKTTLSTAHIRDHCLTAHQRLTQWQHESEGYLVLSEKSLKCFLDLKEKLKKMIGGNASYTDQQLQSLMRLRNHLRVSLRKDIGVYHTADIAFQTSSE